MCDHFDACCFLVQIVAYQLGLRELLSFLCDGRSKRLQLLIV